jgi:hypothetical protein
MNDRSRFPLRQSCLSLGLFGLLLGAIVPSAGCGQANGAVVTQAVLAGCETPAVGTVAQTNQTMLPGTDCGGCHSPDGQATNSPWTVSGTVFSSPTSACGSGGVSGLVVQVLDPTFVCKQDSDCGYGNCTMGKCVPDVIQANGTLFTNSVGNFWSAASYSTPLTIRVFSTTSRVNGMPDPDPTKATKTLVMTTQQGGMGGARVDCGVCHSNPPMGLPVPPGRIYFN